MATINSILNKANPGQPADDNTPDVSLTYKVYNDTDNYTNPQVYGSSISDANVIVSSGSVNIQNVVEPSGVGAYKISSVDAEGKEGPLSLAYTVLGAMEFNTVSGSMLSTEVAPTVWGPATLGGYNNVGVSDGSYDGDFSLQCVIDEEVYSSRGTMLGADASASTKAWNVDSGWDYGAYASNTSGDMIVFKDGVAVTIDTPTTVAYAPNDTIAIRRISGVLKVYYNDTEIHSFGNYNAINVRSKFAQLVGSVYIKNPIAGGLTNQFIFSAYFFGQTLDTDAWNKINPAPQQVAMAVDDEISMTPQRIATGLAYNNSIVTKLPLLGSQIKAISFTMESANQQYTDFACGLFNTPNPVDQTTKVTFQRANSTTQVIMSLVENSSTTLQDQLTLAITSQMRVKITFTDATVDWYWWNKNSGLWVLLTTGTMLNGSLPSSVYFAVTQRDLSAGGGADEPFKATQVLVTNYDYTTETP